MAELTWYERANLIEFSPDKFSFSVYGDYVFVRLHWILLDEIEQLEGNSPGKLPILLHLIVHDKEYGSCQRKFLSLEVHTVFFISLGRFYVDLPLVAPMATVAIYVNCPMSLRKIRTVSSYCDCTVYIVDDEIFTLEGRKLRNRTADLAPTFFPIGDRKFRRLVDPINFSGLKLTPDQTADGATSSDEDLTESIFQQA